MTVNFEDNRFLRGFLRRLLLDHYDLSMFSILESHGHFPDRRVVMVHTGQGNVAIKLFNKEHFHQELDALLFLTKMGYPHIPSLIPSATGRDYIILEGVVACAFEQLPVAPLQPCSPEDWSLLGQAAGRLNRYQDCPVPFAIQVEEAITEMNAWVEGQDIAGAYRELTEQFHVLSGAQPVGLIHGEINPANAGKKADGTVALLDWDEAGTGPVALELGYPLLCHFLEVDTHEFHATEARAFYSGYFEENPMELDPEIIFTAGLFHAARYMRFFDVEKRWKRLVYAVENRQILVSAAFS